MEFCKFLLNTESGGAERVPAAKQTRTPNGNDLKAGENAAAEAENRIRGCIYILVW